MTLARASLAGYKVPKQVIFVDEVVRSPSWQGRLPLGGRGGGFLVKTRCGDRSGRGVAGSVGLEARGHGTDVARLMQATASLRESNRALRELSRCRDQVSAR